MQSLIPYLGPILLVVVVYILIVVNALPFWKRHREFRKNHQEMQCEFCEQTITNRKELAVVPLWPFGWRLLHLDCIKKERRGVAGVLKLYGYSMTQMGNFEINTANGFFTRVSAPVIGIIFIYFFKPSIPDSLLTALYALAIIGIVRLTITRVLAYTNVEQKLPQ